jgi:hypothetical protein
LDQKHGFPWLTVIARNALFVEGKFFNEVYMEKWFEFSEYCRFEKLMIFLFSRLRFVFVPG